jgi:hypothetical protein
MTISESVLVAAAYADKANAEAAVGDLVSAGVPKSSISLVYTDPGSVVKEGLLHGAVFGGVVGGLVGLLFPPIGVLIAAGPIVGTLASAISSAVPLAVAGAAVGGIASGLVELGMPKEMADRFGGHVHKGDAVVIVHAATAEAQKVRQILEAHQPRTAESSVDPSATVATEGPAG